MSRRTDATTPLLEEAHAGRCRNVHRFNTRCDRDAQTEEFRGKAFRIETRPPQRISIDGEVLASTPVTVQVAAGAVEVAVP